MTEVPRPGLTAGSNNVSENPALAGGVFRSGGARPGRDEAIASKTDPRELVAGMIEAGEPFGINASGTNAADVILDQDDPYQNLADFLENGDDDLSAPLSSAPATPVPPAEGGPQGERQGEDDAESDDAPIPPDADQIAADVIARCAMEPPNDVGNAMRLLNYYRDDIVFVDKLEAWHAWDGQRWTIERGRHIAKRRAQSTAARIVLEADYLAATPGEQRAIDAGEDARGALSDLEGVKEPTDDQKKKKRDLQRLIDAGDEAAAQLKARQVARRRFAVSSGNAGKLKGMIDEAAPHRNCRPQDLDLDPLKFNVKNGTLRFFEIEVDDPDGSEETGFKKKQWTVELLPHNRADLISRVADVEYDPAATCPIFESQISRFQPIESVREFLRRYYGYALTGLVGAQCLVFNYGEGSNWKSTFTEVIRLIFNDYALKLNYASISGEGATNGSAATPDLAELPGARFVYTSEIKRGTILNEALIKDMSSGEPMTARANFKDPFRFEPRFKLVMTGNHKPQIGGVDHGIWRRIHFVPWEVMIGKSEMRDMNLVLEELMAERSGVLNWLVKGCLDFLNYGLRPPAEVLEATEAYREESDPVGSFVADCVERVEPPTSDAPLVHWVSCRDMYYAYVAYCNQNSLQEFKEKGFGSAMSQKGFKKDRLNTLRRYINVKLHDVPEVKRRASEPPPADPEDYVP